MTDRLWVCREHWRSSLSLQQYLVETFINIWTILSSFRDFAQFVQRFALVCYKELCVGLSVRIVVAGVCWQIEGILWDTCTGSDARLHRYYAFWEAKIFRALTNMVVNNLRRFITIVSGDRTLCKMFAMVALPEVVLLPSPIEVAYSLLRTLLLTSA